ncbi:MAG TPA: pyridoxamine 5'-phosphate oxidase family protein [Polyangiales bacterium]|nr:pyridoxamine 5'-phosphate oxidase family protein [Polyangiales bacterium]
MKSAQDANGSGDYWSDFRGDRTFDHFSDAERAFIADRDSFYMATVSETGWPYIQHRGGPKGFVRALDDKTLGFADFSGNRQYISVGNLAENDRAFLFAMDYAHRRRVKIWGRARIVEGDELLLGKLAVTGSRARVERAILFDVDAWDVNCPQHIPQKIDASDAAKAIDALKARIAELEAENASLRGAH